MRISCGTPSPTPAFDYSWPDYLEHFDRAWRVQCLVNDRIHVEVKHGLGARDVYGHLRPHSVTFVDGEPRVEGVAADDFARSGLLLSRIKRADNKTARTVEQLPAGLEGFSIVDHRSAIDAPYSPRCLAVAIASDDAEAWARFAVHRVALLGRL